jgi:predicted methyltransferase
MKRAGAQNDLGYVTLLGAALFAVSIGLAGAQGVPDYAAIIAAPDRTAADRDADKRRDPLPFLKFSGLRQNMKVLDMGAGGGYSTELLARVVAPNGTAYGQNAPDLGERPRGIFEARTKTQGGKNIVALFRPYDDPLPADVREIDAITFLFYYHDTTYMPVDRAKMNQKLFAALKPGAALIIADHSAKPGDGATVGKTLHRIEEATVRQEVEAAGFKLSASGDFWRAPDDTRDFSTNRPPKPVDNFVLKFTKP